MGDALVLLRAGIGLVCTGLLFIRLKDQDGLIIGDSPHRVVTFVTWVGSALIGVENLHGFGGRGPATLLRVNGGLLIKLNDGVVISVDGVGFRGPLLRVGMVRSQSVFCVGFSGM